MVTVEQRRRYNRLPVLQSAMLSSRQVGILAGEILNFSANGLLFNVKQSIDASVLQDQTVSVSFTIGNDEPYRLSGKVVRRFDRSLGIAVTDFVSAAYRALILQANAHTLMHDGLVTYPREQREAALTECDAYFRAFIRQAIDGYHVNLNTRLSQGGNDAVAMQEQWLLQSAYPQITRQRERIESAFLRDYKQQFASLDVAEHQREQPLSLVAMDEFDDWLAVTQRVNRLQQAYNTNISQFELRYAVLNGVPLQSRRSPYHPNAMLWVFHHVLAEQAYNPQLKIVLYEAFYLALNNDSAQFYRDLNGALSFVVTVQKAKRNHIKVPAQVGFEQQQSEQFGHSPTSEQPTVQTRSEAGDSVHTNLAHEQTVFALDDWLAGRQTTQEQLSSTDKHLYTVIQPQAQAVPDFGINQLLWQFNWLISNSEICAEQSVIDMLANWPDMRQDAVPDQQDVLFTLYDFPMCCVPNNLLKVTQSTSLQNVESAQQLSHQRDIGHPDSDMVGLLRRMLPTVTECMARHIEADKVDADKSVQPPLLRAFELFERFYAATDVQGNFYDHRLKRLLTTLTDRLMDESIADVPETAQEVVHVLENLLTPIAQSRKLRIVRVLTACQSNVSLDESTNALTIYGLADVASLALVMLSPGDWLLVTAAGFCVPWQVATVGQGSQPWLVLNSSATSVAEYTPESFNTLWRAGSIRAYPEYAQPMLHRDAYRSTLNDFAAQWQCATRDALTSGLNRCGLIARLDWLLQATRGQSPILWLGQIPIQGAAAIDQMLITDPASLQGIAHIIPVPQAELSLLGRVDSSRLLVLCHANTDEQARQHITRWLSRWPPTLPLSVDETHIGVCGTADWISNARQWLALTRLAGKHPSEPVMTLPASQTRMGWYTALQSQLSQHERVGWSVQAAAWAPKMHDAQNHPCHELTVLADRRQQNQLRALPDDVARPVQADIQQLHNIVEWLHQHPDSLSHLNGLSVGVSVVTLNHPDLRTLIERISGDELAAKLIFRLPENMVSAHLPTVMRFVQATRVYGYRYCLDQVGCLHPDMSWLTLWRPNFIRVNRQLVREAVYQTNKLAFLRALIATAHALDIRIIACTHHSLEFDLLREMGVDYLFSGSDVEFLSS